MIFRIPRQRWEEDLQGLAILEFEVGYLIRARPDGDSLVYVDAPIFSRGTNKRDAGPPIFLMDGYFEIRTESEAEGLYLIYGHSHPEVEGEPILPLNCGWTLPRTAERRDYLFDELGRTVEGRNALAQRRSLLERTIAASVDEREELENQFMTLSPQMAILSLTTIANEVPCYISNRVDIYNEEELRADVYTNTGDVRINEQLNRAGISGIALIHADRKYLFQPSSRDKFRLSVLHIAGKEHECVEGMDVQLV